jgi:hypothetical protein
MVLMLESGHSVDAAKSRLALRQLALLRTVAPWLTPITKATSYDCYWQEPKRPRVATVWQAARHLQTDRAITHNHPALNAPAA